MILLAVIVAAHGIRGAVKVKCYTQEPANIVNYGPLYDEQGREFKLKLVRVVSADHSIVTIKGIDNRNAAEALKGAKLFIERSQLPDLVEEEFYHSDLIGLRVEDLQGESIGRVNAVSNFGAGDFLEIIDSEYHHYTIAFTRNAVPIIQLPDTGKEGVIKIERQFLLDSTASQDNDDRGKDK
jgi:16S rRNA processing protein RimM